MNSFSHYFLVFGLALFPAVGNFAGAVLAEKVTVTDRARNFTLHGATGIILGIVGLELMPRALNTATPWLIVLAYLVGGMTYILIVGSFSVNILTHPFKDREKSHG